MFKNKDKKIDSIEKNDSDLQKSKDKIVIINESEKRGRKIAKKVVSVLILIAIIVGSFYGGVEYGRLLPASYKNYSNNKVYATIGDAKITGNDLNSVMGPIFYSNGLQKMDDSQIETLESTMLEYLVNIEVLYKEAKENNIEVTDDQVQENYDQTISNINSQYNLSEEEYLEKFDLTEEKLKQRIKKELMGAEYLEDYSDVSEEEAKNYYEKNKNDYNQVRVSHILISNYEDNEEVSDSQKEKNKQTAEELLKMALDGEDFSTLANTYSDDSSASNGGDLGYLTKDEMGSNFAEIAFSMENGEIYDEIIETSNGYHIIKKIDEKNQDFDDIKDDIIETLEDTKQTILMQDLYTKYDVKIND